MATISLTVNGQAVSIEAAPEMPLLWALRDSLGLVGTKFGCGGGFCGACTVHVDGAATRSCTLPLAKIGGRTIVTIEGLSETGPGSGSREPAAGSREPAAGNQESAAGSRQPAAGRPLHAVQRAWVELDVAQCGYCQAGQIMTAAALLARTPNPTDEEIATAMNGNLCRCGTYMRIREAVRRAANQASTRSAGGAQ